MFEQATLENGPAGKKVWATLLGMTGQVALVSLAILIPLVSPQVLPLARFDISLVPPVPPGPKPLGEETKRPVHAIPSKVPFHVGVFTAPTAIPTGIPVIEDDVNTPVAVVGGTGGPVTRDGVPGGTEFFTRLLDGIKPTAPVVVAPPPPKAPVDAAPVKRYTIGGNVHLGTLLHKAEPVYPGIAKAAHMSGAVELECVVGVNGHITEVKVKSGNALLVKAAVDAAWQFVYAPSQLNGVPIEIVTYLTFHFKLNP